MRKEYAKASSRLNIFSKIASTLNSPKDPESQEARIRELEAEVAALKQSKAGEDFTDEKHKNVMNGMNEKINPVIPDVLTEPRDLAVARAESQYSDKLLLAWQFSCTVALPEGLRYAASESWPAARLPAPMR